jgi:hypothetical protein
MASRIFIGRRHVIILYNTVERLITRRCNLRTDTGTGYSWIRKFFSVKKNKFFFCEKSLRCGANGKT